MPELITSTERTHFLYRHIRLDKNEPFYIGIGTIPLDKNRTWKLAYKRAYTTSRRNRIWKSITAKTEYRVEIVIESSDYNIIKDKEVELVALYGRKDLETGTLANMSDGGDANLNIIITEEIKQKVKDHWKENDHPCKGVPRTEEDKLKMSQGKIGKYKGENAPLFGVERSDITKERIRLTKAEKGISKRIININTGFIYYSMRHASEVEKVSRTTIKIWADNPEKHLGHLTYYTE